VNETLAIDVRGLHESFGALFSEAMAAAKTTTIRILCGLLTPGAGEGACLGLDIIRQAQAVRRQVGYMTQRFSFYGDLTVAENFVARLHGIPARQRAVRDMMERMELSERANQQAWELSGSWKQRLALDEASARAFAVDDRRRVLRRRGNKRDARLQAFGAVVTSDLDLLALMNPSKHGLGHVETEEDVLRREQRHHRRPHSNRFAGSCIGVGDATGGRSWVCLPLTPTCVSH
jgi:hypothetical protein